MNYPTTIANLIECYKKLPGIGGKTAERLALATLNLPDEITDVFSDSIKNVKNNTKRCQRCNSFCENDLCDICKDKTRDESVICVVEDPKNVILFEKVGVFKGVYHVLNGLISPLDGVSPDDINIDSSYFEKTFRSAGIERILPASIYSGRDTLFPFIYHSPAYSFSSSFIRLTCVALSCMLSRALNTVFPFVSNT